jgi:hypothetical protein
VLAVAVLAAVGLAQVPSPEEGLWDPVRFHEVDRLPEFATRVVARATWDEDALVVYVDGNTTYAVRRGRQLFLDRWAARLPPAQVRRISDAASAARAKGARLSIRHLTGLVRLPLAARQTLDGRTPNWLEQHQESDGSWSPADFDWNCGDTVCPGRGDECFRVAATSLLLTTQMNAGLRFDSQGAARPALDYLRSRQLPDGGFAASDDPHSAMTNACGAIALCRALAVSREQGGFLLIGRIARLAVGRISADQRPNGSWGSDGDEARKLSTVVWNLIALRAAATSRLEVDPGRPARGLAWVEKTVAAITARADGATGSRELTRARACRAMARMACGASEEQVAHDVSWLVSEIHQEGPAAQDAEVLLFGSLASRRCSDPTRRTWSAKCEARLLETESRDGCAKGSWTTRSAWWDLGGRPFSTALMTWALQVSSSRDSWGRGPRPGFDPWPFLTEE